MPGITLEGLSMFGRSFTVDEPTGTAPELLRKFQSRACRGQMLLGFPAGQILTIDSEVSGKSSVIQDVIWAQGFESVIKAFALSHRDLPGG